MLAVSGSRLALWSIGSGGPEVRFLAAELPVLSLGRAAAPAVVVSLVCHASGEIRCSGESWSEILRIGKDTAPTRPLGFWSLLRSGRSEFRV